MRLYRVLLVAVAAALTACGGGGGDDGGTTGPPPPPGGNQQTLGSITPNATTLALGAGSSSALTITAYDAQNYVIQNAGTPTFSSSNTAVAEVDGNGQVLALFAGSAQINVSLTYGGVTRTAVVTVTVTGVLPNDIGVIASSGDYVFTPKVVAIQQGGSVNWTFGPLEHTVTFSIAQGAPASITSGYSGTVSRTFATRGNFTYNCQIHSGMGGQVIVR